MGWILWMGVWRSAGRWTRTAFARARSTIGKRQALNRFVQHKVVAWNSVMWAGLSTESTILDRIRSSVSAPSGSPLKVGIGDDCAVFRPRGGSEDLLFTTDMLLEDIHFRRTTHSAEDAGYKALARGLSDIAAMGGAPRFCLLSLAVPHWADRAWVDGFYRGILRLSHKTATPLAGGDLASAERMACDVIVCGAVPKGRALLRA